MGVITVVSVMGDEFGRHRARGQLGHEHEHLAGVSEHALDKGERVVHLAVGIGHERLDSTHFTPIRLVHGRESRLALFGSRQRACSADLAKLANHQVGLSLVGRTGRSRSRLARKLAFAHAQRNADSIFDRIARKQFRLRFAQFVAQFHDHALLVYGKLARIA